MGHDDACYSRRGLPNCATPAAKKTQSLAFGGVDADQAEEQRDVDDEIE